MYKRKLSAPRSVLRMATDPISNTVAITLANPLYVACKSTSQTGSLPWAAALAKGSVSQELAWPILHELTHHASLQTPVGNSLSALSVSHTSVVGGSALDANELKGPARDLVRYRAADTYFRPLLEGLALFAEFDASSGDFPIASWTSQVSARLFCFDESRLAILGGKDVLNPLKSMLEQLRTSSDYSSRKLSLFDRGIGDPDAYLLGYLLVKALWSDLCTRQMIWQNSDMFMMFLNDYFFSDFLLAHHLVSTKEMTTEEELSNIQIYLHNKVVSLSKNCGEFGREFAEYHLADGAPRPSYQNHSEALEESLAWEWTSRTLRGMHWQTPDFRSTRCIPRVLAAACEVSIDVHGEFEAKFHDGSPPMRGPALDAGRPANKQAISADGSVEAVVLLPQHGRRKMQVLICVFLDKDLVATFDPETGDFNDKDAAQACDKMASFLAIEAFVEQVEDERWIPKGSAAERLVLEFTGDRSVGKMLELWAPFALCPELAEPDRPEVLQNLIRSGLKETLNVGQAYLQRIVETSLLPIASEEMTHSNAQGLDLAWIESVNKKSMSSLGFRFFNVGKNGLSPGRI